MDNIMDDATRIKFGFSHTEARRLSAWGFVEEWHILSTSDKQLFSHPGIGPATVDKIRLRRKNILLEWIRPDQKSRLLIEAMA
jgi:hypothetical protein